jgi:exopolyphosphatase / guanosine-5'-triphosphate,3'-diphosphate pyrophosphatase
MSPSKRESEIIAAIDVGTNSFHMVIASVSARGVLQIHARAKETVRLGQASGDIKKIHSDAAKRGMQTLKQFAIEAQGHGARIRAVATSAVREAANREEFVDLVQRETGIEIEVVSGIEEGRLIYVGALHALPIVAKRVLVIDIGGGSTESVIGFQGETSFIHSAKLGHIRLTRRFFPTGTSSPEAVEECRNAIRGDWSPVFQTLIAYGFEEAIGTSGTIMSIATMAMERKGRRVPESLNGMKVSRADLLETIEEIIKARTAAKRAELPGMDPKRGDVIIGGALILEQAIIGLNIQELTISGYALREGIVFDTVQKERDITEFHHLSHLRYQSVDHLCEVYRVRRSHAEHVKNLCLQMFDDLKPLHGLGDTDREILEAAALLHDVGYHIAADQHHKHSEYIIRNSPMPGFTNDESRLIACVARYHRKSHPKKKHESFAQLHDDEQQRVRVLAGILRIAEGLDRRQQQIVRTIRATETDHRIDITIVANETIPDIEVWGAERRKGLMEETFGRAVRFQSHQS